jgi:hypothetical protein
MEQDKAATREYSPEVTWRCHTDESLEEGLDLVVMTNEAGGRRLPFFDSSQP